MENVELGGVQWRAEYVDKGVEKATKRIEREAEKARKAVERLQRQKEKEEARAAKNAEREAKRNSFFNQTKRLLGGRGGTLKETFEIFKGAGAVAGLTFAADAVGDFAERVAELNAEFDRGEISQKDYWTETARMIPIIGTLTIMFDRLWAAMDGSAEEVARLEAENKRFEAGLKRQEELIDSIREKTWQLVDAREELRNRNRRIGLKDEELEAQRDREERDAMFAKNQTTIDEFEAAIKATKDPLRVKELQQELDKFKVWAAANLAALRDIQERERQQRLKEKTAKSAIEAIKGNFEAVDDAIEKRQKELEKRAEELRKLQEETNENIAENFKSQIDAAFEKAMKRTGVERDPLSIQRNIQGAINKNYERDQLEQQKAIRKMFETALTLMQNPLAAAFAP